MSLDLAMNMKLNSGDVASKIQAILKLLEQMSKQISDDEGRKQIDETISGLNKLHDVLVVVERAVGDTGEETQKTGKEFDELHKRANIENLQELAGSFQGIAETLFNMTHGVIESAATFEDLYAKMLTVTGGSKEMADEMMAWAEKQAELTPFDLASITDATAKFEAYGLKAKEVLTTVGDLAAGYGKGLDQAVEAVADAQQGELERLKEFGITKQMLIQKAREEFHAEIVNAQGQITDLDSMNEALFSIMEERTSGAMGRMANTYHGAMNNFKDSVTKLQAALGKELLPILTDLIRWLTTFLDHLNGLGSGFTGVLSQALLFTTAIAGVSSGLISAGLQLQAFKTQLLAANAAAAASGTSFTAMSVSLTGIVPVVGAVAIVFGTLANAYITAWRKMEEQKAEKIVEETKKIESGFENIEEAIKRINKTPLELAFEGNIEQRLESVEARIQAIRELQIENLKLMNQMEGKEEESTVTVTTTGYNKFSSGLSTKSAWVPAEPGEEGAMEYTKTQTLDLAEAYDLLSKNVEIYSQKLASVDPKSEEHDIYNKLLAESSTQLDVLIGKLDRSNPAHAEQIKKWEELTAKLKEAGQEHNVLITTLINAGKAQDNYVQPLEEANKAIDNYVIGLDRFQAVQNALGEATPALQELAKKEKISEEDLNKTLESVAKKYGVTVEEITVYAQQLEGGLIPEINDDTIDEYIDSLDALISAEKITADKKKEILERMLEDERLSAEAQQKIRDELAKSTKEIVADAEKTEKDRWDKFETAQKTALARGEITERQYWENVKKYLDENEKNLESSQDFKLQLTQEYYEGIKKLGDKDVQDEKQRLQEKEKNFRDHLNHLKDLEEIGEISPEEKIKQLQQSLNAEKLTEEQRIELKKEILATEQDIAKEKERLAKEEEERQRANLQLEIETLETSGQVWEAKKLQIQAEVEAKQQAGLDEVAIENWKNAQLAQLEQARAEQNRQVDQELLSLKKQHIEEEITAVRNSAEQTALLTGNRVAAERVAHQQVLELEKQLTDVIVAENQDRIAEIQRQAKEMEKSGTDRIKVEEFVAESMKNLQLEVFNDFVEKENAKREEIKATQTLIEDLDKKLAENRQQQSDLQSTSLFGGVMTLEEMGKQSLADKFRERQEQLNTLKAEEKSLEEQKAAAFEKERQQQEELKLIMEQKNKVQEAFNTELEKTVTHYDTIKTSSPWAGETVAVQQYTKSILEALSALQELNAEGGSSGGEGTGGGSAGGGGVGGFEGYSGKTEKINNLDEATQDYTQNVNQVNENLTNAAGGLLDFIQSVGNLYQTSGFVDESGNPIDNSGVGNAELGIPVQPEAFNETHPMPTSETTNNQTTQSSQININNTYNINGAEAAASANLSNALSAVVDATVQTNYPPAFGYG